jgi:hypothetical protein
MAIDGRKLALTIILGVFIAVMVVTLVNLTVSYVYEGPQYDEYCEAGRFFPYPGPVKEEVSCSYSKELRDAEQECYSEKGQPVYEYDENGCNIAVSECDYCNKEYEDAQKIYNRNTFFVFAAIGFALIVSGLFWHVLLIQIIMLPAGAFLVIEAAVRNFDSKLIVIVTFALLIVAAVYLALKKLR